MWRISVLHGHDAAAHHLLLLVLLLLLWELLQVLCQHILRQLLTPADWGEPRRRPQHIHIQLVDMPLLPGMLLLLLVLRGVHPMLLLAHQLQLLLRL
jgi:hypothetical protein